MTNIGLIFDRSAWAWPSEVVRLAVFFTVYRLAGVWSEVHITGTVLTATLGLSLIVSFANMMLGAVQAKLGGLSNSKVE